MKKIGMIVAVEMKAVLERYGTPQEEKEYPGYRVLVYEAEGIEHTAQHENRRSRDHFLTSCQPVYSRQQVPMYAKGQQHLLFTDR